VQSALGEEERSSLEAFVRREAAAGKLDCTDTRESFAHHGLRRAFSLQVGHIIITMTMQ
jgi:hypothetical protein